MPSKKRISINEAGWLMMDSSQRPMHVATLLIYSLPDKAAENYLSQLVQDLREEAEFSDPFNKRLIKPSPLGLLPLWKIDSDLDMEYHVRHLALPRPGGERELGMLVSRLHSNPMDKERPLWEYHVIEGLENNRFAVYFKMHHALVDGIAGIRMLQRSMSTNPEEINTPALWAAPAATENQNPPAAKHIGSVVRSGSNLVSNALLPAVQRLGQLIGASMDEDDPITLPFQTPVSKLNARIHSQRRFATQLYDFERIRKLSKAGDCTINDIILALCSGALRRFLRDLSALPGEPLTAGIPMSLRAADDQGAGSAVTFLIANLATNIADPLRRLNTIKASTRRAKSVLDGLSKQSIDIFTALLMSPFSLQAATGLEGRTRPVFNVTVSNVPGPREPLYFRGSKLEAMYPVSAVTHGQALNITCYSYAGTLSFGFAACRDTLPRVQRLAVFTGEALEELERALLPEPAGKKSRSAQP
ncbi:wax ester/triacylglycerol synthase family O-acyltransferase [Pseudomaricurvus alcaniphilus]|nr:wax ester/triacylglycerol synthase family O-acyltransferase [Pseudomaricurvus alcaniphilus]